MKSMKEIIIGQMEKGPETLNEVAIARKIGSDIITEKNRTNRIISSIHALSLNLTISNITEITSDAKVLRLTSDTGYLPVFEAGQYINIFTEINGVRTSRPYSISSSPKQRAYYEICVARIPTGFVSDFFLDKVSVGDKFEASSPQGTFRFNPVFHYNKSVFLAGGSGITPFMSMTREILESGTNREIHLIYGVRKVELAIFHKELTEMSKNNPNFYYNLVLSDSNSESSFRNGFIDSKCIKEIVGDIEGSTFYMCGPTIMTDFCSTALEDLKVKPKDIRREMFGARQDIQNEPGWPDELSGDEIFKLTIGDKTIDAKSSESLLISLERSGVRVNVCCRSGECSLCRVKLKSGKVFLPRGVWLRHADEKFGYIHSCKAYPTENIEIAF